MAEDNANTPLVTGGCQCGAIRYAVRGPLGTGTICHCRMCQKASGGPFMVFVPAATADVSWTRGSLALFASSTFATRGFCRDCGTPLTYHYKPERLSLSHGSLDDPSIIEPVDRLSSETVLPWSEHVGTLPIVALADWIATLEPGAIATFQHPDHD